MTEKGAKTMIGLIIAAFLLFIVVKIQESESYQKYIEIDGCVFLETYHVAGYSSSKTHTLIGCDTDVREKYKKRLNIKF